MSWITVFAIFVMVATTIGATAQAQTYNQVSLTVDGRAIQVGTENPVLVNVPSGQVYGTIHIAEPQTISCSLADCVSEVSTNQVYGAWDAKVSGTMGNTTAQIQLVNSQGQITYTIVLMPEQKPQITMQDPSPFGLPQMPEIQNEVIWIAGAIVAVVIGIVVYLATRKGENYGKIRRVH